MSGPPFVTRWDLDKTYLRTEFDTVSDLVRTALERPDQKRAVPGAAAVLRLLGETGARVHILSGSPRQLRARLEEKLRIDRVRWDELTLKPNLSNMLRGRFRALRDQLGYKLPVLLEARLRDQGTVLSEILVGDDAEADAFVYSLYADICDGTIGEAALEAILAAGHLYSDQRELCRAAQRGIRPEKAVGRILIHLDRQSPPSRFEGYGARVVPFYNYFQAALVLLEDGCLGGEAVLEVAAVLVQRHRFDAEALGRSYLDLLRRGHAQGTGPRLLRDALGDLPPESVESSRVELETMVRHLESHAASGRRVQPLPPALPDYVQLAARHGGGKNRKQFRALS